MWPRFINALTFDDLLQRLSAGGYQPASVLETPDVVSIFARVAAGGAVFVGPTSLTPLMPDNVTPIVLDDLDLSLESWLIWRRWHTSAVLDNLLEQLGGSR